MKTANQMQHLSAHKELTRNSSLLMDNSKLPFFNHVFIQFYYNKLKNVAVILKTSSRFLIISQRPSSEARRTGGPHSFQEK